MTRAMLRLMAATLATGLVGLAPALGQEAYPSRTIKIVAPFPAGAPVDSVARLIADRLERAWRQPVVVENRGPLVHPRNLFVQATCESGKK